MSPKRGGEGFGGPGDVIDQYGLQVDDDDDDGDDDLHSSYARRPNEPSLIAA